MPITPLDLEQATKQQAESEGYQQGPQPELNNANANTQALLGNPLPQIPVPAPYYPGAFETPNLNMSLTNMPVNIAENFVLLDAEFPGSSPSALAWKNLTGDLTETQVIPWDGGTPGTPDTGISRTGVASLAVGNGSAGDFSGSLKLTGENNQGGLIVKRVTKAAGYTATASDYVMSFTATAILVLDSAVAVAGTTYRIKLSASATVGSTLTIAPNNSKTIDGAATLVMATLGQSVDVVYDSANNDWQIF